MKSDKLFKNLLIFGGICLGVFVIVKATKKSAAKTENAKKPAVKKDITGETIVVAPVFEYKNITGANMRLSSPMGFAEIPGAKVKKGKQITILEEKDDFYRIGTNTWLRKSDVKLSTAFYNFLSGAPNKKIK